MATITGLTAEAMQAIVDGAIVSADISDTGHLIFTKHDSSTLDAGAIFGDIPNASTSAHGVVQLATNDETTTGTNTSKAVTPAGLAAVTATLTDAIGSAQPADSDLTAIAGLTPSANDLLQYIAGAWTNKTPAQILAALAVAGVGPNEIYNGTVYGLAGGAVNYVGNTDPGGTAADGSVWFDTA
jgi:hypothetical protein